MGVCLCGIFFHLLAKPPPASLLKHLGLKKTFIFTSQTSVFLLTVCFSLKNSPEFRSCLHPFKIANRITSSLQRLVWFWLFSFPAAVIERHLDLFPSIQLTWLVTGESCSSDLHGYYACARYLLLIRKQWLNW